MQEFVVAWSGFLEQADGMGTHSDFWFLNQHGVAEAWVFDGWCYFISCIQVVCSKGSRKHPILRSRSALLMLFQLIGGESMILAEPFFWPHYKGIYYLALLLKKMNLRLNRSSFWCIPWNSSPSFSNVTKEFCTIYSYNLNAFANMVSHFL